MRNIKLKINKGFTLVEMLISITIFMIFTGIVAGSYTSLVAGNRRANETQKIYREVRNIFDMLASEARSSVVDYSLVPTSGNRTTTIGFLHANGNERTLFRFDEKEKQISTLQQSRSSTDNPWLSQKSDWQALTSREFPLEDLAFVISPTQNPYVSENASNDSIQFQPAVTILLTAKGYQFRTTYSSRTYGTKNLY